MTVMPQTFALIHVSTDRKSLLALRGVGPESEAESVRFHGRRVTKVGPKVKHSCRRRGWGPLNKGCERRTRALPEGPAKNSNKHLKEAVKPPPSTLRRNAQPPVLRKKIGSHDFARSLKGFVA